MEKEEVKKQENDEFNKIDQCGERAEYHNLVDILFVLDATGSMSWCMDEMKKTVCKVMKKFADKQYDIKFAIELYRDHQPQDFTYVEKHFDLRNIDKTIKVIDEECEVGGGGDLPQAVFDGLVNGLKKTSWRISKDGKTKSKRFLFHGCDAPPHGQEYGRSSSDSNWTKKGCPCGLTRHDVKKLLDQYNVDYSLMKIGKQVEIMSGLFKECFGVRFKRQIQVVPSNKGGRGGRGGRVRRTSQCYMAQIQHQQRCAQMPMKPMKLCAAREQKKSTGFFDKISSLFSSSKKSKQFSDMPMPQTNCRKKSRAPPMKMALECEVDLKNDAASDSSSDSQKGGKKRSMASLVCSDIEDGVQSYFQEPIKKQKKVTRDI